VLNHYELLGVTSKATKIEIKSAFKEKALLYHPDRHFGDSKKEEHFKLLNEAYQTLSNDYARAKYDLLQYQKRVGIHSEQNHHTDQQTQRNQSINPNYKPKYKRTTPSITSKENLRATAYAFLFALTIGVFIKFMYYGFEFQEANEYAEVLESRRGFFEIAQDKYRQDSAVKSLELVMSMGRFHREEQDMRVFKDYLLQEIKTEGDQFFEAGKYQQALEKYEVLEPHAVNNSVSDMKKIAFAYKGVGEIKKAIDIYRTLQLYGYESMDFYYEMGLLYEEGVGDYRLALRYYQISADKAMDSYNKLSDEVHPVMITADIVPKQHYDIYMKIAEVKYKSGLYQDAIKAVAWSKTIWPDSLFQYQIEIKSLAALNLDKEKNEAIAKAYELIPTFYLDD